MRYNARLANPIPTSQSAEFVPLDFPGLMADVFRTYGRNFRLWFGIAACYEAATLPLQFLEPTMGQGLLAAIQNPNPAYLTGQVELLALVKKTGSIGEAARRSGMSYMRAWSLIQTMNQCFKEPLVLAVHGGQGGGGGAKLTETGRRVLVLYRQMERASRRTIASPWKQMRGLLSV